MTLTQERTAAPAGIETAEVAAFFRASDREFESSFEFQFMEGWVRARWDISKLGEEFPGGYWLVQNPVLHFESPGRETIDVRLINGEPSRATVAGQKAFRRMRGNPLTEFPLSYAIALPQGEYSVRFSCELFDCRRLVLYCDAMQFFAGDFADMVRAFEDDAQYWASKNHAEAAEPFRFPCDLLLGTLEVPADHIDAPYYHVVNEAELPPVAWEEAYALVRRLGGNAPMRPEKYFDTQLKSGISWMRENNFCRWGTHCLEEMVPPGSAGTGLRPFAMWGNSFALHYALTGDADSGAAGHYAALLSNAFIERGPNPHQQHVLPFGVATMMVLRYARATGHMELLDRHLDIWRRWPYDWNRHNLATEPAADGSDTTANDTYNMKLVGAVSIWLLGKYAGDASLMEKARDCVLNFVLPGLLPQGYWYYRPGSPEGALVNGIQSNNHYDGFVKMLLSRLLMHEEWRREPGVIDALKKGMDFSIQQLTEDDGRVLKWELHPGVKYGPRETRARYLGHAGMFCEPLYVLARYCDDSYLQPLQRSLQLAYDLRDDEVLKDYWDNAWLYSLYGGLFTLSTLGVEFHGDANAIELRLGEEVMSLL